SASRRHRASHRGNSAQAAAARNRSGSARSRRRDSRSRVARSVFATGCAALALKMKIHDKDVAYVADLAHLELTPEERAQFGAQLDSILGYIEQLNELDTSAVEPMSQVLTAQHENETLRDDEVGPSFTPEAALSNAPES